MGWTETRYDAKSVLEFFKPKFDHETPTKKVTLLELSLVKYKTAYGLMQIEDQGQPTKIIAVVILVNFSKGTRRSYWSPSASDVTICYKEMTESCGPCETDFPKAMFKKLTPLPDPIPGQDDPYRHARDWRASVQKRYAERAQTNKVIQAGKRFMITSEDYVFSLGNGEKVNTFSIESAKPFVCRNESTGTRFRFNRTRFQNAISAGQLTAA